MIHTTLGILKEKLNEYFKIKTGTDDDRVKFLDSANVDPISFPNNVVTPFLINVSEDRTFRKADPYRGLTKNGIRTHINPEIRLELLVLFVSKFTDYNQSLNFLSYIIKYFQTHRVFDQNNAPTLAGENIEKLIVELMTVPLSEQNEIWSSLRATYLPSVLYKINTITYMDDENIEVIGKSAESIQRDINETGGK